MAMFGRPTDEDDQRAEACRDWLRRRNPYAIASLVLGVFSLIEMGVLLVFGIAGIAMGVVALLQLKRAPIAMDAEEGEAPPTHGHRLAWTGIALSAASLLIAGVVYSMPARG